MIGCLGPVNGPTAEVKTISMRTGLAALKIIIIKTEDCKLQEKEMAHKAEVRQNKLKRDKLLRLKKYVKEDI